MCSMLKYIQYTIKSVYWLHVNCGNARHFFRFIMSFKIVVVGIIFLVCALGHAPLSAKPQKYSLILAADMPDMFDDNIGKYAELKSLIEQQKSQNYKASFFVFGGGSLGPSAMAFFDKGAHIIDVLNSLEPDVMGTTKREFSYATDELLLRSYESVFPMVASNIIDTHTGSTPDGLSQIQLIKKQGLALGFISIVNSRLIEEYLIEDLAVTEPTIAVTKAAAKLREMGADIILLHYSFPFDFVPSLLNENIIDIAFLSDTRLQEQYKASVTQHPRILFLETPGEALQVEFAYNGGLSNLSTQKIKLKNASPNSAILAQVANYRERLKMVLSERLGVWANNYSTRREDVRMCENAFANFIVDAMKDFANTDIALLNGGSIRGDKQYFAGTAIVQRDIATELPFRSRIKVLSLQGKDIIKALEVGLSQVEEIKGGFPHVAGIQVKYNSKSNAGSRLVSVTINGEKLEPNTEYSVATTDYLANGGDGYLPLLRGSPINPFLVSKTILIADLVARAITQTGTLESKVEGRIIDVSQNITNSLGDK